MAIPYFHITLFTSPSSTSILLSGPSLPLTISKNKYHQNQTNYNWRSVPSATNLNHPDITTVVGAIFVFTVWIIIANGSTTASDTLMPDLSYITSFICLSIIYSSFSMSSSTISLMYLLISIAQSICSFYSSLWHLFCSKLKDCWGIFTIWSQKTKLLLSPTN